jgi:hypothetical protein
MTIQDQLDKLANEYNKTKDPKYREVWYKLIKELAYGDGYYNSKGRTLPFDSSGRKSDD